MADFQADKLYGLVLREIKNDSVQELDSDLYQSTSKFLGKLRREEYDNIERKIKDALVKMTTDLTSLLLKIRLEKATKSGHENLLDEEKFILDARYEMDERREVVLGGILSGKYKFLEFVVGTHKTKLIVVRFHKEMDQFVGADHEGYGPYRAEDVATVPLENAQSLIAKDIATKIRWEM